MGIARWIRRAATCSVAVALLAPVATPAQAGPDYRLIHNRWSDKCLTVLESNTADGAKVGMWQCNGYADQQWYWNGEQIRSKLNDKCLFNSGTADGAPVLMWACTDYADRRWYTTGEQIRSSLSDKCLFSPDTADGSAVLTWTCALYADRRWY